MNKSLIAQNLISPEKWQLIVLEEVDSTSATLAKMANCDATNRTVVIAEQQNAGKGQHGRNWHSPYGKGIWMSVLLKPNLQAQQIHLFNLFIATLIADVLEANISRISAGMSIGLKWPNDLWINGKKCCGILPETVYSGQQLQYCILGIGINVNQTMDDFPNDLAQIATSLFTATNIEWSREMLISDLLNTFLENVDDNLSMRLTAAANRYRQRLLFLNETQQIAVGDTLQNGIVKGISDEGFLLMEIDGSIQSFPSAQLLIQN